MSRQLVLGVDLGTHGVRILAVDASGKIYCQSAREYERVIEVGGIQEQPMQPVKDALWEAIRDITSRLEPDAHIEGIGITHQRGTVVSLDAAGQVVGNALCDSDTRSWVQAKQLQENIGAEQLYLQTGCPPLPFNGLTKILYRLSNQPEYAHKVKIWASVQDWAVLQLTGSLKGSAASALRLGVLDVQNRQTYAKNILLQSGLNLDDLPSLCEFNTVLGRVTGDAAGQTGLPAGIPVFPVPGDQPASVLGCGKMEENVGVINLGTSFLISFPRKTFPKNGFRHLCTAEILPEDWYALELGGGAGTNVLDWMRNVLFESSSLSDFISLQNTSVPGSNGLRIIPRWWSAFDKNITGSIKGLQSCHTRGDMVRAAMEGLVCEVKLSWEKLEQAVGDSPDTVVVFGGASQNKLLCQILADTLKKPVYRPGTTEASALGAALCATLGLNWFDSVAHAAESLTELCDPCEPDPRHFDIYEDIYAAYKSEVS